MSGRFSEVFSLAPTQEKRDVFSENEDSERDEESSRVDSSPRPDRVGQLGRAIADDVMCVCVCVMVGSEKRLFAGSAVNAI